MGPGGQTPMRLVDGRCPSLLFFTPCHRTRTPHRQQCRRRRHSGGGAKLPDILFVIVQWCLPPPERRDRWFRRGDE